MLPALNLIGWLACVVYSTIPSFWLTIHPSAKNWRSRPPPYRVLLPIWMAMWIAVGLITARWRGVALYSSLWAWMPAGFPFGAGFWLYSQSGKLFSAKQLGDFQSSCPEFTSSA